MLNYSVAELRVKGFRGNTPLSIYIKKGKIVGIKPLANKESPNFFNKVKQGLLNKWNGMKASGKCKAWHCLLPEA